MNLYRLFAICFVLLSAVQLSARLGETEAELVKRYGNVVSRTDANQFTQGRKYRYGEYLHFRRDDWKMRALLIDGKCEEIFYSKSGQWAEEQIVHLLELNGGRSQWEEQNLRSRLSREWKRRDQSKAVLAGGLEFKTPTVEQVRQQIEKQAKEDASKLPKF